MSLLTSSVRSIVIALIVSTFVVNPVIKHSFFPDAVKQSLQEAYEKCDAESTTGYDCF